MANKRTYKTLTKAQSAKVKKYTKKGKTQAQIAKSLGVSKQRVSTAQAKAQVGKRRPSPFWSQVKKVKQESGYSHKEATRVVFDFPKWGKKRHKNYQTTEQRIEHMKELRKAYSGEELGDQIKAYEDEDVGLGETPK